MHLTDHDLRQLDRDALSRLGEEAVRRLAERLLADLKDARDRLNQDSRTRTPAIVRVRQAAIRSIANHVGSRNVIRRRTLRLMSRRRYRSAKPKRRLR
mgnify:CR=1 FL=1